MTLSRTARLARPHPARGAALTATALLAAALGAFAVSCSAHAADAATSPPPAVEKVSVRAVAHFGFDRTAVLPADQGRILAEVSRMQGVTWQTVTATGHADSVGNPAYNERLSQRRAEAVKAYLVAKGLDPAMITVMAKGAADPVADNDSDAGRSKNRRTDIEFQGVRAAGN